MHRAPSHIDHFAGKNVDPVQQLLCAFMLNRLLEGLLRGSSLQPQRDFGTGLGVGNVPAFVLATGLTGAVGSRVIGMYLHRQFLMWEKELCEQWKTSGICGGFPHQFPAVLGGQLSQRFSFQMTVRNLAITSSQPRFADLLLEAVTGIDRR